VSGDAIGEVAKVEGGAGASRVVINGPHGEILIPLAVDICVEIDVANRKIRIDAPEGLLELNETKRSGQRAAGSGQKKR
jgi:ribosomal 30S subunit maturation factor RimM